MPAFSTRSGLSARAFGHLVVSAFITIIDTFNRANSSELGSPAPGQSWKLWRGTWGIASNKASSSSTPSEYAMATLTFTNENVTVGVASPDVGTGMSFWVTDANNWYAAVYVQTEVCGTCTDCTGGWNASNCNQFSGGNCKGWTCNDATCTGGWNTSNCNGTINTGNCNANWNCGAPSCAPGANWNASTCANWNTSTCAASNPSTCAAFNQGPCVRWNNRAPRGFCAGRNPGSCIRYNPSNCIRYNASNCIRYNASTCIGPWTCETRNCNGTINAGTCNGTFNTSNCVNWFCNQSNCTGGFNAVFCSGNFNPSNCNGFFSYSCGCQTENRINIISSISSTITTVVSTLWSSTIASFKSVLGGSNVTIKAYSSPNYTSQIGSDNNQSISSPTKTKRFGIIKAPSALNQGSGTIDEFRVEE